MTLDQINQACLVHLQETAEVAKQFYLEIARQECACNNCKKYSEMALRVYAGAAGMFETLTGVTYDEQDQQSTTH